MRMMLERSAPGTTRVASVAISSRIVESGPACRTARLTVSIARTSRRDFRSEATGSRTDTWRSVCQPRARLAMRSTSVTETRRPSRACLWCAHAAPRRPVAGDLPGHARLRGPPEDRHLAAPLPRGHGALVRQRLLLPEPRAHALRPRAHARRRAAAAHRRGGALRRHARVHVAVPRARPIGRRLARGARGQDLRRRLAEPGQPGRPRVPRAPVLPRARHHPLREPREPRRGGRAAVHLLRLPAADPRRPRLAGPCGG